MRRWVAQAGSDPKSDNTVRVMATNRKTFLETVPDTRENSQCSSSQQEVPHCDTDIDRTGGVHTLCWRSTSTVYEEIPSVCSQSIDTTVDDVTLLVCCGSCRESCLTPLQHVLTLTMGVQLSQVGDVNARRRLSLAVLVCDNHMHDNHMQALG